MKTTITYKNGSGQEFEDAAPVIDPEEEIVCMVDEGNNCISENIPLALVQRIEFELD